MSASAAKSRRDEGKFNIKFAGSALSSEDVVEAALKFGQTHTVARVVETELPIDFLEHPGCMRNTGYDSIREHVLRRGEGIVVENDAMLVAGSAGPSPENRYNVDNGTALGCADWGSENAPMKECTFHSIHSMCSANLMSRDNVFVFDGYVGACRRSRKAVRIVTEMAWHHHFCTNTFIRPSQEELKNFKPDFTILNCTATFPQWKEEGLRSERWAALDVNRGMGVISGVRYAGEMKSMVFSIMNFILPMKGILTMKCAANVGAAGDTTLFFGLNGTGKTSLSADPTRFLIGDDEHGWDEEGVFNLEGGCYANVVDLDPEKEPLIYSAIRMDAILEHGAMDDGIGVGNLMDRSCTENARLSFPMWHMPNHEPTGVAGHPTSIILLTCDAYGVLPLVSKLTTSQALYHLVSGYSSKASDGAELGEPTTSFSPFFGGSSMSLTARGLASLFQKKMVRHNVNVYLINTGRTGQEDKRVDIDVTREIVAAVLDGSIEEAAFSKPDPHFQFRSPVQLPGIDNNLLDAKRAWRDHDAYKSSCQKLAALFRENFMKYESDPFMAALASHGPGGDTSPQPETLLT